MNGYNHKNYVAGKTKIATLKKCFELFAFILLFSFCGRAQNVSYSLNSTPISGSQNSAFGFQALFSNSSGAANSAFGFSSLQNNIGNSNAAFGFATLNSNTTGGQNTGIGGESLRYNTTGTLNTSVGNGSSIKNTTGNRNSSVGWSSMSSNTTGNFNSSLGAAALWGNITGNNLTAIGYYSNVGSSNLNNATAIGSNAIVYSSNSIQLGDANVVSVYAGVGSTAKLISGGLQVTGGILGAGKVLTSDPLGNATWQAPSGGGGGSNWSLFGNAATVDGSNFIGTIDNVPFNVRVNNLKAARLDPTLKNSFYGIGAGIINTTGTNNSVFGNNANLGTGSLTNATSIGSNATVNASNSIQLGDANVTTVYAGTGTAAKLIAGGLQVTGGILGAGKVLTSDAVGNATWQTSSGGGANNWSLLGNAGTVDGTNFIGTTDVTPLNFRLNSVRAGRLDYEFSCYFGLEAGPQYNHTGRNCAFGGRALSGLTTGVRNSAFGTGSMGSNSYGSENTAMGLFSLSYMTEGNYNSAVGNESLSFNLSGDYNSAVGYKSTFNNLKGNYNSSLGAFALNNNQYGNNNIAIGYYSNTSTNIQSNSVAIGANSIVNLSNKIRLGDATVTEVEGPTYMTMSDGRFKTNVNESDVEGLEFIKKLRPVVYNFDTKAFESFLTQNFPDSVRLKYMDKDFAPSTAIRQSGFIAQEVEEAANAVGYNFNGVHIPETKEDNYSLAYAQFVVPLVKAVQELNNQNTTLRKELDEIKTILKSGKSAVVNEVSSGSIKITESDEISSAKLFQNAPNPFSQTTTIKYSIPASAQKAIITITTLTGIRVKAYNLKTKTDSSVEISGGQLTAGSYIYSLIVDDALIDSKQMILTRK